MVPEHDEGHATHTTEGSKIRSDHIAGGSTQLPEEAAATSEAVKIRSDGLGPQVSSPADVDDTDEATKIESDGLRTTTAAHSATTEATKIESDGLH